MSICAVPFVPRHLAIDQDQRRSPRGHGRTSDRSIWSLVNPTRATAPLVGDTVVIRLAQALEMPTLKLHVDAYRLLRSAHRLSDAARGAITATQDSENGLWSF